MKMIPFLLAAILCGCAAKTEASAPLAPTAPPPVIPSATPAPANPAAKVGPQDFSVPFYPGAKFQGGGRMQISGSAPVCSADLQTDDTVEAVVAYYEKQMHKATKTTSKDGPYAGFMLADDKVSVTVSRAEGKAPTKINLVSSGRG